MIGRILLYSCSVVFTLNKVTSPQAIERERERERERASEREGVNDHIGVNVAVCSIDYRCEDRKEDGELKGDIIGATKKVLTPFFRTPQSSPPKMNSAAWRCI